MNNYQDALNYVMDFGVDKGDRTGTGMREVFGMSLYFDLQDGFPLVTTKKTWFKGVLHELLWLISGDTNIQYLLDNGVHIWNEWANEDGDLGPIYSHQWRRAGGVDQLQNSIDLIQTDPNSRRNIVESWNVSDLDKMALPPCHKSYQFCVQEGLLHLKWEQRSCDMFLGLTFNIASYALLLMMVAKLTNLKPGQLSVSIGSAHIYHNHFEQVEECLKRKPLPLPEVKIHGDQDTIDDFVFEDFELIGYKHHPGIKGAGSNMSFLTIVNFSLC